MYGFISDIPFPEVLDMISLPVWFGAALSALMIIAILAFSDRFSRYGLGGWKKKPNY